LTTDLETGLGRDLTQYFGVMPTSTRSSAVAESPRAMLGLTEYFAKSLEVTKGHSK